MVCSVLDPASLAISFASATRSETVFAPSRVVAPVDLVSGSWAVVVVTAIPNSSKMAPKASGQKVSTAASALQANAALRDFDAQSRQCRLENSIDCPEYGACARGRRGGDDKAEIPAAQPDRARQDRGG